MLDEYLNRILAIIAELRELLEGGDLPADRTSEIKAALSRVEQAVNKYK